MDDDKFSDFLQEAEDIVASSPEMDEANTRAKVVRPMLEALGWDITADAILEFDFQMGSTTHRVDYALTIDDTPQLFVEVKGRSTDLTDRHLEQLRSYMKTRNVDWGLLTNGEAYHVCRRRVNDDDNVVVDVLGTLSLEELSDSRSFVSLLSKESIEEGRSEEMAAHVYELREALVVIENRRDSLVDGVASLFVDELGEAIEPQAKSAARAAVQELADSIEGDAMGAPNVEPGEVFWNEVEANTGIVKQGSVVMFPDSKNATDCFADFVAYLFERDFLDESDVPMESGPKRYLINDEPYDQEGDEMYSPREIVDGLFLETNYSKNDIKQRILELGERWE